MIWWNPFAKTPARSPVRRKIQGPVVAALLQEALRGRTASNYRHIAQKRLMAVCDMTLVADAARAAHHPWKADVWECEDIARAALHELQLRGANEGCSFAAGLLRAAISTGDIEAELHVYLWALVANPVRDDQSRVMFYDPTNLRWVNHNELEDVDYTLT